MSSIIAGSSQITRIVIPAQAPGPLALAAMELQKYARLTLGNELPVAPDKPQAGAFFITTPQLTPLAPMEALEEPSRHDRCQVTVRDGCVWLVGENERSALYAVYDFLRLHLNVGFFGPGEEHEVVPRQATLVLPEGVILRKGSAFPLRCYYVPADAEVVDFYAKNRINTIMFEATGHEQAMTAAAQARGLMIRGPGHNWRQYIPAEHLFTEHPEYFPMIDGRRVVNGRTACFSNPEVRRIFMENLRAYLCTGPKRDIFAFWAEDVFEKCYCACPECARRPLQDWYMLLANEAAAVAAEEQPEALFEFIVYQCTEPLPTQRTQFFDDGRNMLFFFCGPQTRDLYSPLAARQGINAERHDLYRQWLDYLQACGFRGQKLLMEYFNLCEWQAQGPRGRALLWPMDVARQDALDYLRDGWEGEYNCACFDRLCWPTPFYQWCWLQLYDDPQIPVAQRKREFYPAYFGPAAGSVEAYMDALERLMDAPTTADNVQAVQDLAGKLNAVAAPAGQGRLAERITLLKVHHAYCVLMKQIFLAVRRLDQPGWLVLEESYREFWERHRGELAGHIDLPPMFAFNLYDWYLARADDAPRGPRAIAADPTLR
jgi:hypothetical protein